MFSATKAAALIPVQTEVMDAALVKGVINALHASQPHAPAVNDISTSTLIKYLVQRIGPDEMIGATHTHNPLDMNTIVTHMSS